MLKHEAISVEPHDQLGVCSSYLVALLFLYLWQHSPGVGQQWISTCPCVAAFIGLATQTKLARFVSAGPSALHTRSRLVLIQSRDKSLLTTPLLVGPFCRLVGAQLVYFKRSSSYHKAVELCGWA